MKRYAERGLLDPGPPEEELKRFLARGECAPSTLEVCQQHAPDVQPHTTDVIGIGIGSRLELEVDKPLSAQKARADHPKDVGGVNSHNQADERSGGFNSTDVAHILCRENFWSGRLMIEAVKASVEFKSQEMPECSLEEVGEWLVKAFLAQKAEKGDRAADPLRFFQQAKYPHSARNSVGASTVPANDPAAYALAQMEGD
jgi:hypothetical protein